MLNKQAKMLSEKQQAVVLDHLARTHFPERNQAMFLLSTKAGLRAKEIASLTWSMVMDAEGKISRTIHLTNKASKGAKGGRIIHLHPMLQKALEECLHVHPSPKPENRVIWTQRSQTPSAQVIVNFFHQLYKELGFEQASSHSGRRTFITNAARKITSVGGSLRDVQYLAGHASLQTTQRYIEHDSDAMKKIITLV